MQQYGQAPPMRIPPNVPAVFSTPPPYQAHGSLKTDGSSFERPAQMSHTATVLPHTTTLTPSVPVPGPSRQASPPPATGSYVEAPPTARMWQAGYAPANFVLQRAASQPAFPPVPVNVVHGPADMTLATVPMPALEVATTLSHGPSSQVRLEQMSSLQAPAVHVPEEIMTTRHPPNAWVQRSAKPELGGRQTSCTALRVASNSPSRSAGRLPVDRKLSNPGPEKVLATQHDVNQIKASLETMDKRWTDADKRWTDTEKLSKDLADMKANMELLTQGRDTSEAVKKALQSAQSTGDLRCAIQRAEETKMPETELHIYKESLRQKENCEKHEQQLKAKDEQARTEKARSLESENGRLRETLRIRESELAQVSRSKDSLSTKLQKEEQTVREFREKNHRLNEDKNAWEGERQALQEQCKLLDKSQKENEHLAQRNRQLIEEVQEVDARGKQDVAMLQQKIKAQADSMQALQTEVMNLHHQLSNESLEKHHLQEELAKIQQQEQVSLQAKEKENADLRNQQRLLQEQLERKEKVLKDSSKENYTLEAEVRKSNWSMNNASPASWLQCGKARDLQQNASRENTALRKKNQELETRVNEFKLREQVIWKYMPVEQELNIQHELEAVKSRGHVRPIA